MQATKKKLAIAASSVVNDCCFEIAETSNIYCFYFTVLMLS